MIITFIGHGKLSIEESLKAKIAKTIENCIKNGADTFYCGGYGAFDYACAKTVNELKAKYPEVKSFYITPYITDGVREKLKYIEESKFYDGTIYPELENVPLKFAISKRNESMIDSADIIIAFIDHHFGGAYTSFRYAKRRKKTIINLSPITLD